MIEALLLSVASAVPGCEGAPLAVPAEVARASFIVVGETHGTNEAPAFTGRLVCALAARGEPVTLALELTSSLQDAIDAYMASDGSAPARVELVKHGFMHPQLERWDGRGSAAWLALVESARVQARAGRRVRVVAMDVPTKGIKSEDFSRLWRERDVVMARNVMKSLPSRGKVVAHAGGLHAARHLAEMPRPAPYSPLAWLLPQSDTVALIAHSRGGKYWGCVPKCGENTTMAAYDDASLDGTIAMRRGHGYDGIAHIGPATVAMPPRL